MNRLPGHISGVPSGRVVGMSLLAGLVFFTLARAILGLNASSGGVAPIWLANAAMLVFILLNPRAMAVPIIAGAALGGIAASLVARTSLPIPLLYTLANMVELVVATIGLKLLPNRRSLSDPAVVGQFLLWGGGLAPFAGACIGATTGRLLLDLPFEITFLRWFFADGLGLLLFTPMVYALASGNFVREIRGRTARQRIEFAAIMLFAAASTGLVFFVARYPALFLLALPMTLAAFRTGWLGTKMALLIVATVAGLATMNGHGPILRITDDPNQQIYYFQIYMAVLMLIQMPVAATLATRDKLFAELRESERKLRLLASQSHILLLSLDLEGRCERVVGSSAIMLDDAPTNLVGGTFSDISKEGQYALRRAHDAALEDVSCSHVAEFRTEWPRDAWLEAVFRAQFDATGRCTGTIATIHDVTVRKNQELSLSRTAITDSLTGLLNRAGFRNRLEHALLNAARGGLSLAVIDVDRFKIINDNSGHGVGDLVLREIARRVSGQVRASDAVARLGGDEFVLLLPTTNWAMVREICDRVVRAVNAEPVALPGGNQLRVTISCGVARYREGLTAESFLNEADLALYKAKRAGRNQVATAA